MDIGIDFKIEMRGQAFQKGKLPDGKFSRDSQNETFWWQTESMYGVPLELIYIQLYKRICTYAYT